MSPDREEGVGLYEKSDSGEFVTSNNTNNPDIVEKYGDDSYYVSYGDKESHVTQLFDPEGNELPDDDQPDHGKSGS